MASANFSLRLPACILVANLAILGGPTGEPESADETTGVVSGIDELWAGLWFR